MARKNTRLSKLAKLYKKYKAENPNTKFGWPPSKKFESIILNYFKDTAPKTRINRRGALWREAKQFGYEEPYSTSTIKKLENFILEQQSPPPPPSSDDKGPWDITYLLARPNRLRKYLLQFSKLDGRYLLKLDNRILTLSNKFFNKMHQSNVGEFGEIINNLQAGNDYGSDVNFVIDHVDEFEKATVIRHEDFGAKELPSGGFFPYTINQNLRNNKHFELFEKTLERYVQPDNHDRRTDCLGWAILQAFPEKFESYLVYRATEPGTFLQRNRLGKLAKAIELNILFHLGGDNEFGSTHRGKLHFKSNKPDENPTIYITAIKKHYMLFDEKTEWETIMINDLCGRQRKNKPTGTKLSSLVFIKHIIKKEAVIPFTPQEIMNANITFEQALPNISYQTPDLLQGHVEPKPDPADYEQKIFPIAFDTETYKGHYGVFTIYQLSYQYLDLNNEIKTQTIDRYDQKQLTEYEIIKRFLSGVYDIYRKLEKKKSYKIVLFAHNLGFDLASFMRFNHKAFRIKSRIGNSLRNTKAASFYFYDCPISLQDSNAYLNCKLDKFPKMFKLQHKKGEFPYDAMNKKVVNDNTLSLEKALEAIPKDKHEKFMKEANEFIYGFPPTQEIRIIDYSRKYCEMDVKLLWDGMSQFRQMIKDSFNIELFTVVSTPALGKKVLHQATDEKTNRKFTEIPFVKGALREFVNRSCVGGRTCLAGNKKWNCRDKQIVDFDVTSLYPAAFTLMDEVPLTAPKILNSHGSRVFTNIDELYKALGIPKGTWFFCDIQIIKVNKPRLIPSLSTIDEKSGTRNWADIVGTYTSNHIQLDDFCNFQEIEFKFLGGVYYPKVEGMTISFKSFFQDLFKKREDYRDKKHYGEEGNPLQLVYKLLMNSQHGKMTQHPIKSTEVYMEVKDEKSQMDYDKYVLRNFQEIEEIRALPKLDSQPEDNKNQARYLIKKTRAVGSYFNRAQVASVMYAYSKRIMNEVIYLAEDNGMKVYYTDTDSMFFDKEHLPLLEKLYKEKYNKELIIDTSDLGVGRDVSEEVRDQIKHAKLGSFHSDFDVRETKDSDTWARGVFIGKKSYFLNVEYTSSETLKPAIKKSVKMKGVPENSVNEYFRAHNTNFDEVADRLFNGEELEFDLVTNQVRFDMNDKFQYKNKAKFTRKVKF